MIGLPDGTCIWPATGMTDMHRGFDDQESIAHGIPGGAAPIGGLLFIFRGRHIDLVKRLGVTAMDSVSSPSVWSCFPYPSALGSAYRRRNFPYAGFFTLWRGKLTRKTEPLPGSLHTTNCP